MFVPGIFFGAPAVTIINAKENALDTSMFCVTGAALGVTAAASVPRSARHRLLVHQASFWTLSGDRERVWLDHLAERRHLVVTWHELQDARHAHARMVAERHLEDVTHVLAVYGVVRDVESFWRSVS